MNTSNMDETVKKMFASIEEKYGAPVSYWVRLLHESGLEKHGQRVNFLKKEHGFSHGFANLVAHEAKGSLTGSDTSPSDEEKVKMMFEGKEQFLPVYEAIIEEVNSFGDDVVIAPKKTYVSLRRDVQFAVLQPSSSKRFDIGLILKEHETSLEPAGSFNSMCTHRVRLDSSSHPEKRVMKHLYEAYQEAKRN